MMHITTFEDDLLGLADFAQRLERFINTEHDFVEGSLVVALTSKYGSGKTTFLQMWKSSLEETKEESKPLVVSLNAWESDYCGDPLFAIISALVDGIQKDGQSATPIVEAAKDFGWFATAIGAQIANKFTGIDVVAAGELAENKKAKREGAANYQPDTFSMYEGRRHAMNSLKEAIRGFVSSSKPNVLFLVDELDRCRPDYAIAYLETIKHIFDIKGAVFLLAADRQQLENSAKTAFGQELDFEEYYRKFVHREITLPEISDSGYAKLTEKYVDHYLEREDSRFCFMELDRNGIKNISELMVGLKLTPRQTQEVFRILGHIFETTENKRGQLLWCIAVGSVAMAALKIGAPSVFGLLGESRLDPKEAADFLRKTVSKYHVDWWFNLLLTGDGLEVKEGESVEEIMKRVGLMNKTENIDMRGSLAHYHSGWGHHNSGRFNQIYKKIQQVAQWN